jgi:hypothetical protein
MKFYNPGVYKSSHKLTPAFRESVHNNEKPLLVPDTLFSAYVDKIDPAHLKLEISWNHLLTLDTTILFDFTFVAIYAISEKEIQATQAEIDNLVLTTHKHFRKAFNECRREFPLIDEMPDFNPAYIEGLRDKLFTALASV